MALTKVQTGSIQDSAVTEDKIDGTYTSSVKTNPEFQGTEAARMPIGTTAQRTGAKSGDIRFNSSIALMEYYDGTAWKSIDSPPTVTSVDDTEVDSAAGGNQTIVITGSNFNSGATVTFLGSAGADFAASTVTVDNGNQITAVAPKSSFLNAQEPYSVKVENTSGLSATLASQINVDNAPNWQTASGSLGNVIEGGSANFTVSATDPDSDTVSYSETTSVLSGAGFSLNSSTGAITGTANAVSSDTTSTFTLRATAGSKTADRSFNIVTRNLNTDALLFDATNLPNNSDVYTSNTDGASVGLALDNGTSISPTTAVTISTINGVTNGTLANGAVVSNQTNLRSHYNSPSPYGEINYGNTFWSMVTGDPHDTARNKAWFGIYSSGSPTNGHIWWTWDLGTNPTVKLKRMVGEWTWRTGSANFILYGSNSSPNSGSAMQSTFVSSGLTNLYETNSLGATFDYTLSNTAYYRYYVLRLEGSGTYDYGLDKVKLYGDYY